MVLVQNKFSLNLWCTQRAMVSKANHLPFLYSREDVLADLELSARRNCRDLTEIAERKLEQY
jgi:hypothetical protein